MSEAVEVINGGEPWFRCNPKMVLGEGPIYRAHDSTLHWVDCLSEPPLFYILKIDPETGDAIGEPRVHKLEDSVTVHFFRKGVPGSYIVAYYQGIAFLDEETGRLEVVKEIIPTDQRAEFRLNDGGIDAKGRFWVAGIDKRAAAFGANKLPESYGKPGGKLWRYDPDGSLHVMDTGFVCGNGLAWSPDNKTMYLNDSVAMTTFAYDFDLESGTITNKRIFIDRRSSIGEPDGCVVDTEGNLWMALYSSHRITVFDPDGKPLKDIVFPAANAACTTWGGKNFDIIFLATASDREGNLSKDDQGGHMFRYKPTGSRGYPKGEFGA